MTKIGNNDCCPCGSGKKYKKCCRDKKPRQHTVMVGSPVPLKGFHYNRETMTLEGVAHDDQLVKPDVTFSQTCYIGESGKEKVLTRTHDKVIANINDLFIHLSSFDMIIAVDTNTKEIGDDILSVSFIIPCVVRPEGHNNYALEFLPHGACLFRNFSPKLSPEKFGWLLAINRITRESDYRMKKYCLVSDHDLDNHKQYNNRQLPILKNVYLPSNFTLMYGRGDGSKENILNDLVIRCEKEASRILKEVAETGCYKDHDKTISISQIPIPTV